MISGRSWIAGDEQVGQAGDGGEVPEQGLLQVVPGELGVQALREEDVVVGEQEDGASPEHLDEHRPGDDDDVCPDGHGGLVGHVGHVGHVGQVGAGRCLRLLRQVPRDDRAAASWRPRRAPTRCGTQSSSDAGRRRTGTRRTSASGRRGSGRPSTGTGTSASRRPRGRRRQPQPGVVEALHVQARGGEGPQQPSTAEEPQVGLVEDPAAVVVEGPGGHAGSRVPVSEVRGRHDEPPAVPSRVAMSRSSRSGSRTCSMTSAAMMTS